MRLVDHVKHRSARLAEIVLSEPLYLPLGLLQLLSGDLARVQQTLLVLLRNFKQARIELMALPHRLRHKNAPQPHAAVKRAGGIEHLEVEVVVPLEQVGAIPFRIELRRKRDRRHFATHRKLRRPMPVRRRQPQIEIALENIGKSRHARIFRVKNRIVQILHPLAEIEHLLPLFKCFDGFGRISGQTVQLIDLAKKPFDLRESRRFMSLHRPLELLLRARLRLARRRAEALRHDADHERQRIPKSLQRLLCNQLLRPTHADGRVVLPVDHLEPGVPDMRRVAIVVVEKPAHSLPFRRNIARRSEKDVVGVIFTRSKRHSVILFLE